MKTLFGIFNKFVLSVCLFAFKIEQLKYIKTTLNWCKVFYQKHYGLQNSHKKIKIFEYFRAVEPLMKFCFCSKSLGR